MARKNKNKNKNKNGKSEIGALDEERNLLEPADPITGCEFNVRVEDDGGGPYTVDILDSDGNAITIGVDGQPDTGTFTLSDQNHYSVRAELCGSFQDGDNIRIVICGPEDPNDGTAQCKSYRRRISGQLDCKNCDEDERYDLFQSMVIRLKQYGLKQFAVDLR